MQSNILEHNYALSLDTYKSNKLIRPINIDFEIIPSINACGTDNHYKVYVKPWGLILGHEALIIYLYWLLT
jgi:hypothetical protein